MLHFLKNKIMKFFNFGRKKRLEKERDELQRKLEELEYELKKHVEKLRRDNNYNYYKKESYYSFDDYDYKDLFNGETFKYFFKQAYDKGDESNYNRYKQEYSSYCSNTALDNAFQLMKLNNNDNEATIKKRYRELSLKWHPDKWATNTVENQAIASRNFVKLNKAYELIKKHKNIM